MRRATVTACLWAALAAASAAGGLPARRTETFKDKEGKQHKLELVLLPAGTFTMGSPEDEAERQAHEGARHAVTIAPVYLCTTEVTLDLFVAYYDETKQLKRDKGLQKPMVEWREANARLKPTDAITGPTPFYGDVTMGGVMRRPATMVSWYSAMVFCKWLSRKTGRTYRLPTEAEWEYAARAGTTAAFSFGDDTGALGGHAWFEDNMDDGENDEGPEEVAGKKPNPWGLYDMHGNVAEWCLDFYAKGTYDERAKVSPWDGTKPLARGEVHVARGGAWDSVADELRSAARGFEVPDVWRAQDPQAPKSRWWLPKLTLIGLRVACETQPGNRWETPAK